MHITTYFFWFALYSFAGWLYESTICSLIKYHHLINRGYLLGPYCPIYGAGAVINMILFQNVESGLLIFILTMITSGAVEYFTSYAMEKLFDARWWDYSHYPLNIKGRICLYGCLVFGIGNLILLKLVHPFVANMTFAILGGYVHIISIVIFIVMLLDAIYTTIRMNAFNEKLRALQETIDTAISNSNITNPISNISDSISNITDSISNITDAIADRGKAVQENVKENFKENIVGNVKNISLKNVSSFSISNLVNIQTIKEKFKERELRILHAFPSFKSTKYESLVEKMKELLK